MSRPWYYVPGRKDLTERRLHRKREIEARRNETWTQINNYFNSCSARCKRFDEWSKIKPTTRVLSLPPYDIDLEDDKATVDQMKLQETSLKLRNLIKELTKIEEEAENLKMSGNRVVSQISFMKQSLSDATDRMSAWIIKSRRVQFVRFTRDKLRHQVFLSFEKLSYFHTLLFGVCRPEICDMILTKDESEELKEVISGAENIIQTFINLNRQRNYEIVNMFQ